MPSAGVLMGGRQAGSLADGFQNLLDFYFVTTYMKVIIASGSMLWRYAIALSKHQTIELF